jgi:hypothetical protein
MPKAVIDREFEMEFPMFTAKSTPGKVQCGVKDVCPATKAGRTVCCNSPGLSPECKLATRCGQASKFTYFGMLSCNENADCKTSNPKGSEICCISDDGAKAKTATGNYNRASCVPQSVCHGKDLMACVSDQECGEGKHCRQIELGRGIRLGGCI